MNDIKKKETLPRQKVKIQKQAITSKAQELADTENRPKKRFYKKFWFWLVLIGGILLIAGGVFLGIYFSHQSRNKQIISQGWHDIVQQASRVTDLADKIEDKESFEQYSVELQKLNSAVDDKKFIAQKMQYKSSGAQYYSFFLNDFKKYSEESTKYANKIDDFTEDNADSLRDLAGVAKTSASNLKNNTNYLDKPMPEAIFDIAKTLLATNQLLLTKELAIQAQQKAEEALTAKDIASKSAVGVTVENYLNAYIAGNALVMRRYMTEAFQKEYDFDRLTPEARQYSYPVSFRILANQKVDTENYKVQANIVVKMRDGTGQFTLGNEISVVYVPSSAGWLVNSIREENSF